MLQLDLEYGQLKDFISHEETTQKAEYEYEKYRVIINKNLEKIKKGCDTMQIDITKLNQNIEDVIEIRENVTFPETYFEKSEIQNIIKAEVSGQIKLDEERDIQVNLVLTGEMILQDSISLEDINYPFSIEIDEKIEKNTENFENTLDILDILWQNIVLEVPLRFTNVNDYSKFKGEGWKLLSEEEVKTSNNPFEDLKSMFGKE